MDEPPRTADRRRAFTWNPRAAQPDVVLGRRERLVEGLRDTPSHLRFAWHVLRRLPRTLRSYRRLLRHAFRAGAGRCVIEGIGLGVSATPGSEHAVARAVRDLGIGRALVRIPYRAGEDAPWTQIEAEAQHRLLEALLDQGTGVVVAIPQDREAVLRPDQWREGVERILLRLRGRCRHFQIGQAINRKKWGTWTLEEYRRLLAPAWELRRRFAGELELLGPPVLDAELHYHLAVHGILPRCGDRPPFDRLVSQLYVDRQGAPEQRRHGWALLEKCAFLAAIAATEGYSEDAWVTEVNWPLQGHGDYSPAAGEVEVDEERYADFMVRYLLLALCSGFVERVYWWQLVARGFGLIDEGTPGDPATWRFRPAHTALRQLITALDGYRFEGRIDHPAAMVLAFVGADGARRWVAWSLPEVTTASLEVPADLALLTVLERDGEAASARGRHVVLGPSPRYLDLSCRAASATTSA